MSSEALPTMHAVVLQPISGELVARGPAHR